MEVYMSVLVVTQRSHHAPPMTVHKERLAADAQDPCVCIAPETLVPAAHPPQLLQCERSFKAIGHQRRVGLDAAHKVQAGGVEVSDELPQLASKAHANLCAKPQHREDRGMPLCAATSYDSSTRGSVALSQRAWKPWMLDEPAWV